MSPSKNNLPWWSPNDETLPVKVTRSKRKRVAILLGSVLAGSLLMGAAFSSPQERPRPISFGITEYPATLDALVATCTGIIEWNNSPDILTRLPWDAKDGTAEAQVAEALRRNAPLRPGFYNVGDSNIPSVAQVAAYLKAGGTVVWYAADRESDNAVSGLESVLSVLEEDGIQIVALPWPADKMNRMPAFSRTESGSRLLFMRWGRAQSCAIASDAVIKDFTAAT